MQPLIDHARRSGQRPEEFAPHTAGRSPAVRSVTCSDSGVVPEHRPGADAFEAL
ncbi:hypothetical protein [Streptomyces sp. NPDC001930]|uniref:hypothetical protein n=1 Tax=Streptomyces sp. NPDC001930 TaxID=3364625 RepID=UPI0036BE25F9